MKSRRPGILIFVGMDNNWRLINLSEPTAPLWNMAVDEKLLESGRPTLRFYEWSEPSFSIGYFQKKETIHKALPESEKSFPLVRRITGGGTVRHGSDLTVSLVLPSRNDFFSFKAVDSYRDIHRVYRQALLKHIKDIQWVTRGSFRPRSHKNCFHNAVLWDISSQGRKILGSSQRRRKGILLHQTSIHLETDHHELAEEIVSAFKKKLGVRFRKETLMNEVCV